MGWKPAHAKKHGRNRVFHDGCGLTHSGRESALKRLSLLRQKKRRPASDPLASVPAGYRDILTSDETERVVVRLVVSRRETPVALCCLCVRLSPF